MPQNSLFRAQTYRCQLRWLIRLLAVRLYQFVIHSAPNPCHAVSGRYSFHSPRSRAHYSESEKPAEALSNSPHRFPY
jgi:hypothetical protein